MIWRDKREIPKHHCHPDFVAFIYIISLVINLMLLINFIFP